MLADKLVRATLVALLNVFHGGGIEMDTILGLLPKICVSFLRIHARQSKCACMPAGFVIQLVRASIFAGSPLMWRVSNTSASTSLRINSSSFPV